ncbi:MAG: DUF3105 domain-containing protein [Chloroflexi bacterium]|nr:DUF3105 domain-containing protein [Chloroflexota bacterium]
MLSSIRPGRTRVRLFAIALGVMALLALQGCSGGKSPDALDAPDARTPVSGVGTPVPALPADHVPQGQRVANYNSTPPTSGPHWPAVVTCGAYDTPAPDELIVHNLEHGNVVISHNLKDPAPAAQLRDFALKLPGWSRWGVLRPYSAIPEGAAAMTAWGVKDEFQGVNESRIRRFWSAYIHNRLSEESAEFGPIPCS